MPEHTLDVLAESFPLAQAFTIARGSRTQAQVVHVRISRNGATGQGECVPYSRYDETIESVIEQIQSLPVSFDRRELQRLLPAGSARNAVDCALWDLEAKQSGNPVWKLAGLPEPKPEITAYTLSLDTPEKMQESARVHATRPLLKIKLGTPDDLPRLEAVRKGAPEARIILDANEGWNADDYRRLTPHLVRLGVVMVEQPLPSGDDDALLELERPVPVCADESCHDRASLPGLKGKYDMINIKLDKTGGLTEALALKEEAIRQGYRIMVGCMVGSSLAMAPGVLVAQGAAITDLDGPLLLASDRTPALSFEGNRIHPADPALWG
ncbi:MAG: N-acetyl-D-Glu racemase DgcA [Balneolaceae bacterium]